MKKKLVVIRGAGELATGIAHRLHNTGYSVLMLEKEAPSAIRRSVVFAEAVYDGEKRVERVTCYKANNLHEAEKLLKEWKEAGDLSEDSFAELAKKNSKDGNAAQGGLYEKVYPGQMVENFENWLYDAERKVGDTGIVESPYGYHIMFFVGDNEQTFRDFMITNVKRNEDVTNWRNDLIENIKLEVLTLKHIELDMVLSH